MKECSSSTRIKICGIRDKANALAAIEAGADLIGLVFAPSQRQVTPPNAREIASAVKESNDAAKVVGVFVNAPAFQINEIADFCALDVVQLSGDESWEYCRKIVTPVIKAIRIGRQSLQALYTELSSASKLLTGHRFITLLDSQVEGKYGGTGESFNWNLAQQIAEKFPVIIAGGLTPANVGQLVREVQPWGVDVSTGVESNGLKDASKIRAFVKAVRSTH